MSPRTNAPARGKRVPLRRDRGDLLVAGARAGPQQHRRDPARGDRLPRRLRLLRRGRAARPARSVADLPPPRRPAGVRHRRRRLRLGRAHARAGADPRQRPRRPAHALRRGARGGALPVDGRRAALQAGRRRHRGGRPAHRRAARVRRGGRELPRQRGVARRGRDREPRALPRDAPPCRRADRPLAARRGAGGGDPPRGALRDDHARRARPARRRRVPAVPLRADARRPRAGRGEPARGGRRAPARGGHRAAVRRARPRRARRLPRPHARARPLAGRGGQRRGDGGASSPATIASAC